MLDRARATKSAKAPSRASYRRCLAKPRSATASRRCQGGPVASRPRILSSFSQRQSRANSVGRRQYANIDIAVGLSLPWQPIQRESLPRRQPAPAGGQRLGTPLRPHGQCTTRMRRPLGTAACKVGRHRVRHHRVHGRKIEVTRRRYPRTVVSRTRGEPLVVAKHKRN